MPFSSIVNKVIRTISSMFIFLTKKIWPHENANQTKINKIKRTKNNKGNNFLRTKTSKRGGLFVLRFGAFLGLKKNKQVWNCSDNLIYNTTEVNSPQPPLSKIYLYALIFVCENLFLFMIICEILFLCVWSLAGIFLNLWKSLFIYAHL